MRTGTVALVNGIRTLTDFKTDRRISAGFTTGQLTGNATIYLQVAQAQVPGFYKHSAPLVREEDVWQSSGSSTPIRQQSANASESREFGEFKEGAVRKARLGMTYYPNYFDEGCPTQGKSLLDYAVTWRFTRGTNGLAAPTIITNAQRRTAAYRIHGEGD